MHRFVAAVFLAAAVLVPQAVSAFTLYTPSFSGGQSLEGSAVNVGNITLELQLVLHRVDGTTVPEKPVWAPFPPGETYRFVAVGAPLDVTRFSARVRAKSRRKTATRRMVRAGMLFSDSGGEKVYIPAD